MLSSLRVPKLSSPKGFQSDVPSAERGLGGWQEVFEAGFEVAEMDVAELDPVVTEHSAEVVLPAIPEVGVKEEL